MFKFSLDGGIVTVYVIGDGGHRFIVDRFRMPPRCKSLDDFRKKFWSPSYQLGKHKVAR